MMSLGMTLMMIRITSVSAAACLPNLFLIGASKSGTTTLYEALAAHPRIAPMYPEPHTHGETHVWSPPQGTNIMRHDGENTLRALRRALPSTAEIVSEEGFGWEMAVRELKRWSLLCLGVHAALLGTRRSARQDLLIPPIRQCKLYECEVHRHVPGPGETSFSAST